MKKAAHPVVPSLQCTAGGARNECEAAPGCGLGPLLFCANPSPRLIIDAETGTFLAVNDAALRAYGYTREELLGLTLVELGDPAGDRAVRGLAGAPPVGFEALGVRRQRRRDGEPVDVRMSVSRVAFQGREARVVVAEEVTAGQRAEQARRALVEVGRELTATLDPAKVTCRIVEVVLPLFGVRRAALYELDPRSRDLVCVAGAGWPRSAEWIGRVVPAGAGLSGLVVAARRPVWSPDVLEDSRITLPAWLASLVREEGSPSRGGVPLLAGEEVVGALILGAERGRIFAEAELDLLAAFAAQAALALRNARLHESALARTRELGALVQVNRAVTSTLDCQRVARAVLEAAQTLLPGCACALWGVVAGTSELRVIESQGLGKGTAELLSPGDDGLTAAAVTRRRAVAVTNLARDPRTRGSAWAEAERLRSALVLPLLHAGMLYGALGLFSRRPREWSREDVQLFESFAAQAAAAIANARLFEANERRRLAAEGLAEVAEALPRSLDPESLGLRVTGIIRRLLAARGTALYRLEPRTGGARLVAVAGDLGPGLDRLDVLPRGMGMVGLAVAERCPVVAEDFLSDARIQYPPQLRSRLERNPHRAAVAMPLIVGDEVVGALVAVDRTGRPFDPEGVEVLQAAAGQVAIALEHLRLREEAARRAPRAAATGPRRKGRPGGSA